MLVEEGKTGNDIPSLLNTYMTSSDVNIRQVYLQLVYSEQKTDILSPVQSVFRKPLYMIPLQSSFYLGPVNTELESCGWEALPSNYVSTAVEVRAQGDVPISMLRGEYKAENITMQITTKLPLDRDADRETLS